MPSIQTFYGLDLSTLTELKGKFLECLTSIAVGGVSYTVGGRSFTRADLAEVKRTIAELQAAIDRQTGRSRTVTVARFSK